MEKAYTMRHATALYLAMAILTANKMKCLTDFFNGYRAVFRKYGIGTLHK